MRITQARVTWMRENCPVSNRRISANAKDTPAALGIRGLSSPRAGSVKDGCPVLAGMATSCLECDRGVDPQVSFHLRYGSSSLNAGVPEQRSSSYIIISVDEITAPAAFMRSRPIFQFHSAREPTASEATCTR